jgi:hypothetical protein
LLVKTAFGFFGAGIMAASADAIFKVKLLIKHTFEGTLRMCYLGHNINPRQRAEDVLDRL